MDFGLAIFPTDETISPTQLAVAAEEAGFESLFFTEHTHIPASRATPWPTGGELPREYARTYDPFVALAAAATVTTRLNVGTGVCLVIQRDPIITAKEVSTLDRLSGGRFLFGVGAGWNREEMANHGTDPRTRMDLFVDRMQAMRALWTDDEASHHGPFVDFDRVWQWPKPVQRPHPPVLVGGGGPRVLDRVLAIGDGWMPRNRDDDDGLARRITELSRLAKERDRPQPSVTLFAARPERDVVQRYAEIGVDRCLFVLPTAGADQVMSRIEAHAKVVSATSSQSS